VPVSGEILFRGALTALGPSAHDDCAGFPGESGTYRLTETYGTRGERFRTATNANPPFAERPIRLHREYSSVQPRRKA
jgi:hypothetical protein